MPRNYFHLHLVSDATGETLIAVSRAAAAQYESVSAIEHVYPLVRSEAQLARVLAEIESSPGVVLYTLVEPEWAERLENFCRELGCPCLSVLQPVLSLFQSYLGQAFGQRPGAQHVLNSEYFRRIDAMNYTLLHDDGQLGGDLDGADVILVGIRPHLQDADQHLSRQSRHKDRQHPPGPRTCRCRTSSTRSGRP